MSTSKIKGYRVLAGFSQSEMAELLGNSLRSYQNKERGITKMTLQDAFLFKNVLKAKGIDINIDDLTY